jgi:hypothetical protein
MFDTSGRGSSFVHCQGHSEPGITEGKAIVFNNGPLFYNFGDTIPILETMDVLFYLAISSVEGALVLKHLVYI